MSNPDDVVELGPEDFEPLTEEEYAHQTAVYQDKGKISKLGELNNLRGLDVSSVLKSPHYVRIAHQYPN